jgi:folate-binding protein YgfZ
LPLDLIRSAPTSVIKISDTRYQINTTMQQAILLWQTLSQQMQPVGSICWDWLDIRSGIPVILPQTQEQFVPQMVNFELIGGVSFKKGCYPGQEIVARMQYLGKASRRMYLAHIDGSEAPQPGDELFGMDTEGQSGGMVANVTPAPGGGYDALVVLQISVHEAQRVHLKFPQGEALQFLPAPYPLSA